MLHLQFIRPRENELLAWIRIGLLTKIIGDTQQLIVAEGPHLLPTNMLFRLEIPMTSIRLKRLITNLETISCTNGQFNLVVAKR